MTDGAAPAPIAAQSAALFEDLRGRRAIVGVPGVGFRGDLRADNAIVRDGRRYVPVLTEQDFYRAESEHAETFALLVPIERVWIERVLAAPAVEAEGPALNRPGIRYPIPVGHRRNILGHRLVQAVPDGHVRDLRAATDVYVNAHGPVARICGEAEWHQWAYHGTVPATTEVSAELLWLE